MSHRFESHLRCLRVGAALGALGVAAAVHAQTISLYVDASAPAGGTGQSWAHALNDLQAALIAANQRANHSEFVHIRIAQGVYTPDQGTLNRNRTFVIGSGVTLQGGFVGRVAMAGGDPDQNDPTRFVSVLSGDLLHNDGPSDATRTDNTNLLVSLPSTPAGLDGLTLRGTAAAISQTSPNSCVIQRCTITDNIATSSTVAVPSSPLPIVGLTAGLLLRCTITDNRSSLAGVLTLSHCLISQCTIAGNRLAHDGSAWPIADNAFLIGNNSSLDACLIAANSSDTLCLSTGPGTPLYNCTIVDNRALSAPGVSGSTLTLYNCIFSRNIATGGVAAQVSGYGPFLFNCFLDHGLSDVQATGGSSFTGTQTIAGTPGFVNASGPDGDPTTWGDNDYRLAAGSPCIDHGNSLYIPNTSAHVDIVGQGPFDDPGAPNLGSGPSTIIDIGAFERAPVPCRADFDHSGTLTPTDVLSFIGAWLSGNMSADFDNSGVLTSHDILEFISVWFSGC